MKNLLNKKVIKNLVTSVAKVAILAMVLTIINMVI